MYFEKFSKAYNLLWLFLEKKKLFILGMAQTDSFFAQVGPQNCKF